MACALCVAAFSCFIKTILSEATVGGTVVLSCSTTLDSPVDWLYQASPDLTEVLICIGGNVVSAYSSRFSINSTQVGAYDLHIHDVQPSDAGVYTCVEDKGFGERHSVQLTVNHITANSNNSSAAKSPNETVSDEKSESGHSSGINTAIVAATSILLTLVIITIVIVVTVIVRRRTSEAQSSEQPNNNEDIRMLEATNQVQSTESQNEAITKQSTPDDPKQALSKALTDIRLRQQYLWETKSLFSSGSLLAELQVTILWKAMQMFTKTMYGSAHRELKSMIAVAKVTKQWCRFIVDCDAAARPQLVSTLPLKNEVIAAVYLDDKIFVICKSSRTIKVYSSTDHRQLETITVDELKQPVDAVSWAEKKSVVVADHEGQCLWKMSLSGKTKKWPQLDSNTSPCTLSLAGGMLSVATLDHRLLTFNLAGKQLRCIKFDPYADPFHAVITPFNKLAVYIPRRLHRRPKMILSSNIENDISTVVFHSPFYLTFDCQGRGFVTNCRKACIFQLTVEEMRRHRLLLSPYKDVMEEPKKLCHNYQKGELLVCDNNKVKVYIVKHSPTWDLPLLTYLEMSHLSKSVSVK